MASLSRTRMPAADRRRQLLDAAKGIVDEHGFHAVTVESVARAAGITRPIVYGHFGDLESLLEALVERESARALSQLRDVLRPAAGGDLAQLLLATLAAYLETVRRDPVTWRLVLIPPEGAPELLRERITAGRAAVVAVLAEVVIQAAPAEVPDPRLTAMLLSSVADEMARLVLTDADDYPVERLVAQARWFLDRLDLSAGR